MQKRDFEAHERLGCVSLPEVENSILRHQERTKNDALTTDIERMNAEMTLRDAEREKLREDLQRETAERKEGGERLRKFLNQLQDLKHLAPGGNVQFMKEAV